MRGRSAVRRAPWRTAPGRMKRAPVLRGTMETRPKPVGSRPGHGPPCLGKACSSVCGNVERGVRSGAWRVPFSTTVLLATPSASRWPRESAPGADTWCGTVPWPLHTEEWTCAQEWREPEEHRHVSHHESGRERSQRGHSFSNTPLYAAGASHASPYLPDGGCLAWAVQPNTRGEFFFPFIRSRSNDILCNCCKFPHIS